jgi:hypothetical protein
MPVDLFADSLTTTVTAGGTTAPSAGTSQSFTVSSSSGWPAAATGVSQFRFVDAADTNTPPEIFACTNVSGTTWTVTRGYEGAVPWAHAANWTAIPVLTAGSLLNGMKNSTVNAYTVTGSTYTLPAITTAQMHVLTLQLSVTLTFPAAAPGASFQVTAIQDGSGGRVITWPGTVVWADGIAAAPSNAINATDRYIFSCEDGTNWIANWEPGYVAGFAAPIPELVYTNASASGSVTLQDPTVAGYTIQRYEVPNSDTLTLVNPTAKAGSSFEVQIETGTGTTVVFPTTSTRWAGTIAAAGSAPTVPVSSVTRFAVECVDGTHWDWAFIGRLV